MKLFVFVFFTFAMFCWADEEDESSSLCPFCKDAIVLKGKDECNECGRKTESPVYSLCDECAKKSKLCKLCGKKSDDWNAKKPEIKPERSLPRFEDVAEKLGLGQIGGGNFSWGDFNNDGFPDLLIAGGGLFQNGGQKDNFKFTDVTEKAKLDRGKCSGVWGDFNNDGFLDIVSTSGALWKNNGNGTFTDISKDANLKISNKATAISWGDYDNDGLLDIYVAMSEDWNEGNPIFYPHQLFHNKGNEKFEDVSEKLGISASPQYGRTAIWCDFDQDSFQEIYVGNYRLSPNFLWKYDKKKNKFIDIAKETNTTGEYDPKRYYDEPTKENFGPYYGHTIGSAWADFNNDGLFDLWVSNLVHKFVGEHNKQYDIRGYVCDDSKIYINTGPPFYRFVDIRDKSEIKRRPIGGRDVFKGDELWSNAVCADFDNDSFVDVFITQVYNLDYAYTILYRNKGDMTFEEVSGELGIRYIDTYSAAWADFNNDGFVDIAVSGREKVDAPHKLHLFMNKGNKNSWVEFHLKGTKSNKSAIGSIVKVKTKNGIQVRQVEGSTGSHSQQNSLTLHFGLGDVKSIDEVEIKWLSGSTQKLGKTEINKIHIIKEAK